MTISVITRAGAIHRVARSLGFEGPALAEGLPTEVIAQALRRAVHILAPCGKHELENAILQSFAGLGPVREELAPVVEQTLEELIVYGDILEMRDADHDHWSRSALVLRPAPPSFVARKNGSIAVAHDKQGRPARNVTEDRLTLGIWRPGETRGHGYIVGSSLTS